MIEEPQIVVHEGLELDFIANFLDPDILTGEDGTEIDLVAPEADAATVGDGDGSVVERILELPQPESYTVLTTAPNALMESIHSRMRVILGESDEDEWLNPTTSVDTARAMCMLCPSERLMLAPAVVQASGQDFNGVRRP